MASGREIFRLTGPSFLTAIDWNNSYHKRSIAASLVQGVYILERDRQEKRQGPQALAPPWWQHFNFKLNQLLIDDHDLSYFGAIYEFNVPYPYPTNQRPPQYLIAFRGTINKPDNRAQDLKLDLHCIINNLQDSRRFKIGIESAQNVIARAGPGNVWLAGHSLGSSIALLIGRHMAKNTGTHLETYLFNPPFASAPIEKIKNEKVKLGLRFANSVLTAGVAAAAAAAAKRSGGDPKAQEMTRLSEKMEKIGAGKIGKLATKHSIGSIVSSAMGKNSEATHLIPFAYLSINSCSCNDYKEAHGIHQWWKLDLEFKYKLYQYK
ncbi:hypothetical protein RD792_007996 [Penstemon davidsonii]|uniref:Fungal lipase-like domain-containing protein n=1 Tax=Penstemon davidsonii TaxID=160366 RepID=A0ABR0D825_9LAMI|nr:hypothetical protein RD792_007996 [Penstemon davidsonii]